MRAPSVLICGCGISGPTLAFWLERAGFVPTVIEASAAPSTGGYMIDFWGSGFDVAARMGLEPCLRAAGYDVHELRVVDAESRARARLRVSELSRALQGRYCSLMRADLAQAVRQSIEQRVEIVFGESVRSLRHTADGVLAEFASGRRRKFDLAIGADGIHSTVRRLAFAGGADVEHALNYRVGAFTSEDYSQRDPLAYVSRTSVGRQVTRFTLRGGRTVFFVFAAAEPLPRDALDSQVSQKAFLRAVLSDLWWNEAEDVVYALDRCQDLYFDTVSQVCMPYWSRGRIALVGDAAYGPSLLAGEGASMAMTGAYVLAGELTRSGYGEAYARYESKLRAYVERKQRSARRLGGWFAPRTPLGLVVRDVLTRIAAVPALTARLVGPMVRDRLALPDYQWPSPRSLRAVDGGRR